MRILIIDDDRQQAENLSALLMRLGHNASFRIDPVQGLAALNSEPFDLTLLDMRMPGIDGFEVLRQIKNTDILKRIPVIVLTSSKEEGDRTLSYDIGANSYLMKPVAFTGFIDVIKRIDDYWFSLNIGAPDA